MTVETHFVQAGDGPVLVGSGARTLDCACGNTLIKGFDPARFLALGIQCGRCGAVTETDPLPEGDLPPRSAIIAAPSLTPRDTAMEVPGGLTVVGQAEMARLQALFQPANPEGTYRISTELLDEAEAGFRTHTGGALPGTAMDRADPFAGLKNHPLAWAIARLRDRIAAGAWACMEDAPTANAVTHVAGFLHFTATWSRHPLFPAMVETAAERGFSLHALAPYAAAHCMTMMGNRTSFPEPEGYPGRIDSFLVSAESEQVRVHIETFDRFEYPLGQRWDHAALRVAVGDAMAAAQGHINLRRPGVLVLSPGTALAGFDEALIEAIKASMLTLGRKNRGLMAAAPVVLRLQPLQDDHTVRFGYGFFPILNRHYRGAVPMRMGG